MCLERLDIPVGVGARVLEPTCGLGSFLHVTSQMVPDSERIGIEIQPDLARVAETYAKVLVNNIFHMNMADDVKWQTDNPLFVIGNPPWVTSSALNRMDSANLPIKENFKGARGLDALLGSSNFDVCEYIILKMLDEFRCEPFSLGMLCKTQVARNVIEYAASAGYPLAGSEIYRIDAMHWFKAAADACWFIVHSDPQGSRDYTTEVHDDLRNPRPSTRRFGVVDGRLVSHVDRYADLCAADGKSPFEWRSGLKHDAAAVFELTAGPEPTTRDDGLVLDVEREYLFPFLKCTDVFRGRHTALSRWVIVPQMSFGADTAHLERTAPKLWCYLDSHGDLLDNRKSSIYRNRPRFSVFGHGNYTFAPYKVAVSGLHKEPVFRLVGPIDGKPVVLDDTCYFLPFDNAMEAALTWAILNSPASRDFIESLVFWDSKRPLTKKLLARIDLNKLPFDPEAILQTARLEVEQAGLDVDTLPSESKLDIIDIIAGIAGIAIVTTLT